MTYTKSCFSTHVYPTQVIDFYHQAIIQSKEADVEQEAIALSRLGQ